MTLKMLPEGLEASLTATVQLPFLRFFEQIFCQLYFVKFFVINNLGRDQDPVLAKPGTRSGLGKCLDLYH